MPPAFDGNFTMLLRIMNAATRAVHQFASIESKHAEEFRQVFIAADGLAGAIKHQMQLSGVWRHKQHKMPPTIRERKNGSEQTITDA